MSRTNSALPTTPSNGDEVTRDGVVYRYNSTRGEWETILSRNLTVVTKDTDQSYFTNDPNSATQTASHKVGLLTIPEVDNNFINLKTGTLALEREIQHLGEETEADLATKASITYVNQRESNLQGQINTLDTTIDNHIGANPTNTSFTDFFDAQTVKNNTFTTQIGSKASAQSPTFNGNNVQRSQDPLLTSNDGEIPTTRWVRDYLQALDESIIPSTTTLDLGTQQQSFNQIHVSGDILPAGPDVHIDPSNLTNQAHIDDNTKPSNAYTDVNLGSPTRQFHQLYAFDGNFAGGTINLGPQTAISANQAGGVLLPTNSSIGSADNTIPSSFASTLIDERFAQGSTDRLIGVFIAGTTIDFANTPVKLNPDGTISRITLGSGNASFIGFALNTANAGEAVNVTVHGPVTGFTGVINGNLVYLDENGGVGQNPLASNEKIGVGISSTSIFLFTTSTIDTYVLNKSKIDRTDLSVSSAVASGSGSLTYDNTTGVFTFTPPNLDAYATTAFVNSEINNLIDSAPGALDTLNELAAAIGDDENFSTTVTNNIALKAPIVSPTLTGTPKAPTPASTSNDTQIATTAFVKSQAGAQAIGGLTNVDITNITQDQVLAFDITTQKFRNVDQSGGGFGINFIVDGGTATTVSSQINIVLDGGGA